MNSEKALLYTGVASFAVIIIILIFLNRITLEEEEIVTNKDLTEYEEEASGLYVNIDGDNMTGSLSLGNNNILNVSSINASNAYFDQILSYSNVTILGVLRVLDDVIIEDAHELDINHSLIVRHLDGQAAFNVTGSVSSNRYVNVKAGQIVQGEYFDNSGYAGGYTFEGGSDGVEKVGLIGYFDGTGTTLEHYGLGRSWSDMDLIIDEDGLASFGNLNPQTHLDINTENAESTKLRINGEVNQEKRLEIRHYDASEAAGSVNMAYLRSASGNTASIGHVNNLGNDKDVIVYTEAGDVTIKGDLPTFKLDSPGNAFAMIDRQNSGNAARWKFQTNGVDEVEMGLLGGDTNTFYITDGSANPTMMVDVAQKRVSVGTTTTDEQFNLYYNTDTTEQGMQIENYAPTIKLKDLSGSSSNYQLLTDSNKLYFKEDTNNDETYDTTVMTFSGTYLGKGTENPQYPVEFAGTGLGEKILAITDSGDSYNDRITFGESNNNGGYMDIYGEDEVSAFRMRGYSISGTQGFMTDGGLVIGKSSTDVLLEISSDNDIQIPTIKITDENDGATTIGETTGKLEFYSDDTSSSYPKTSAAMRVEATNTYGSQYQLAWDIGDTGSTPEVMTLNHQGDLWINGNLNVSGCICYDGGATCLGTCI